MGKENICLDPSISKEKITELARPLFGAARLWIDFEFLGKKIASWGNEKKNENKITG